MELPSRLLSGPDISAGFILQLTEQQGPLGTAHTVHLQEAGTDAASEAAASPSELGFSHPRTACMFGGPRCWEKEYAGGTGDPSVVRFAYNRFRFVLPALLAQRARALPVPVADGLRELLTRCADRFESERVRWVIDGSTGGWIRGAPETPRSIRLSTDAPAARILEESLSEYRIEARSARASGRGGRTLETTAFVGTFAQGVLVSWREEEAESARPVALASNVPESELLPWERWTVPVGLPEFELARLIDHGRYEDARRFGSWLRDRGADPRAMQLALERSSRPTVFGELSEQFLRAVRGPSTGG